MSEYVDVKTIPRNVQRGSRLLPQCTDVRHHPVTTTHEYGQDDGRVFCCACGAFVTRYGDMDGCRRPRFCAACGSRFEEARPMAEYEYGDYVTYGPGYKQPETGRVVRRGFNGSWFVCYNDGCTSACTPADMLRPATEDEIAGASPHIGHRRFDASCQEHDPRCCMGCVHDERG